MKTSTGNIASVSSVGHCSEEAEHHQDEADILRVADIAVGPGGRQRATLLGLVEHAPSRRDQQKPPPISTKLRIWNGPKCGLAFQPNSISSRWPASCENQSTFG